MNPHQSAIHSRLQDDFPFFSKHAPLLIKTKAGELVPLTLNKAQLYIHGRLEKQRADTGKVRALIVKARQEGASTYIGGRFYHKTTRIPGTNTFILTHDGSTTDKLFQMTKRFHDNVHPSLQPPTKHSNRKELIFDLIESEYFVGTAGTDDVARGSTIRLFHGSEVAYWKNTQDIKKGAMEAVPDMAGTEIILESTANGIGNMFSDMVTAALRGASDYQVIFLPWFWMEEYQRPVPEDIEWRPDELEYQAVYALTLEQMAWRRAKIENLGNGNFERGVEIFKQEYPANVHEAFESTGGGLIDPLAIVRARQSTLRDKSAPLIMGVDPARKGDRTIIVFRRGREIPKYYKWEEMDQMKLAGICSGLIIKHSPAAVFIDAGEGNGTIDRLHELGFDEVVHRVHFGEGADQEKVYANKRAEMWGDFRDWLEDPGGSRIPDDDELHKDLAIMPNFKTTSSGRKILPKKDDIKAEYGISPDIGDACALTFAQKVNPVANARFQHNQESRKSEGGLKTLRRFRKK